MNGRRKGQPSSHMGCDIYLLKGCSNSDWNRMPLEGHQLLYIIIVLLLTLNEIKIISTPCDLQAHVN